MRYLMKTVLILFLVFFAGVVWAQTAATPANQDSQNLSPTDSQAPGVIPGDKAKSLGNTLDVDRWTQQVDQYQLENFIVPMVSDSANWSSNPSDISPQKTTP
jgi:hypothetical protein